VSRAKRQSRPETAKMMNRPAFAILAALAAIPVLAPTGAIAALPPSWQSAKEIEAIVADQRVHDALKYEEPIIAIRLREPVADNRVYEITTPRCTLLVTVVYKPSKRIGPAAFDIEVGEATCE